ncbi:hypothetical protein KSB_64940 [Ktedonobacter robiniae]|uniref:Uncharacterized protein n=1 Tax=Ktedonobacter robiniae TaxID=2778365 RepID=A0ABQ3UYU4_9CHLR|nr:hypothetical protein KSB_64940 [Ktedonobacter robiniae]
MLHPWAEAAIADGAVIVALNIDNLVILDIDALPAANGAVGANAFDHLGVMDAWLKLFTALADWIRHSAYVGAKCLLYTLRSKALSKLAK